MHKRTRKIEMKENSKEKSLQRKMPTKGSGSEENISLRFQSKIGEAF